MPVKRPQFANGEIYHIVLRGIAGQKTFQEDRDCLRYFLSLYKFNKEDPVLGAFRDTPLRLKPISQWDIFDWEAIPIKLLEEEESRNPLIEILAICLMPNHIHLLVRQLVDNGISLFFQKMGGYSSYFNKKYQRFGALFQRPFKAVHIETQEQLLIVVTYIHLNSIDLIEPNWKIEGISNPEKVMEFLESYPWSSYAHYLGKRDLSWLISSDFLEKIFEGAEGFQNFVKARVFHKAELKTFLEEAQKFSLD